MWGEEYLLNKCVDAGILAHCVVASNVFLMIPIGSQQKYGCIVS